MCGIYIAPDEGCSKHLSDVVSGKDAQFERKLYREMAELVPAFSFSYSKWNNQKHFDKKIIFRVKETFWDSNNAPNSLLASRPSVSSSTTAIVDSTAQRPPSATLTSGSEADGSNGEGAAISGRESHESAALSGTLSGESVSSSQDVNASDPHHSNLWSTCLYQERSCILIKATERGKYTEELKEGAKVCGALMAGWKCTEVDCFFCADSPTYVPLHYAFEWRIR